MNDSIGLRAAASLRAMTSGTAATIKNLRHNVDNGSYVSYLLKSYHVITPENDFKPQKLWRGKNSDDWTVSDCLLGSSSKTVGWAQQTAMGIRGHTLIWAVDKRIPNWLSCDDSRR